MERQESGKQFARGIGQFNRREFFDAHETWEELWLKAAGPEKTFLQGLIQVAAAFCHYQRGNPAGTLSLLRAGLARLEDFPASHGGIELDALRRGIARWIEQLGRGGQPAEEELPGIAPARGAPGNTGKEI
jgi:uncharacterized protein